jgi:hypothetical protein
VIREDAVTAALAAYPQLGRLLVLKARGWVFRPVLLHDELQLVAGAFVWPGGWSDALAVRHITDARGFRCDPAGGAVWHREGGLVDVIDGLAGLPDPDEPGAPRLVLGTAPTLWVPR